MPEWSPGPVVEGDGGVPLATWDLGGKGPPVLLTHAIGFNARVLLGLADALRPMRRVWALDLRGHGRSGRALDRDYRDWDRFARDILAVADVLAPGGGLAGVGHSLGGTVMLRAEQLRPGTFEALYGYEPPMPVPPAPIPPNATIVLRRRAVFESRSAALANYAAKAPFDSFRADMLQAYVDHGFVDQPDGTIRLACEPEDESTMYAGTATAKVWAALSSVSTPTTIGYGSGPDASGVASIIVERLPHGRLEHHPGLGHFGPQEAPERIGAAVASSLRR